MKRIILDTDFLVHCAEAKVDYFSELERICSFAFVPAVVDKTIDELDGVIAKGGRSAAAAKLAKMIIAKKGVGIIATSRDRPADDLIVNLADENTIVATSDAGLKKRLKAKKAGIIVLRKKQFLVLES